MNQHSFQVTCISSITCSPSQLSDTEKWTPWLIVVACKWFCYKWLNGFAINVNGFFCKWFCFVMVLIPWSLLKTLLDCLIVGLRQPWLLDFILILVTDENKNNNYVVAARPVNSSHIQIRITLDGCQLTDDPSNYSFTVSNLTVCDKCILLNMHIHVATLVQMCKTKIETSIIFWPEWQLYYENFIIL